MSSALLCRPWQPPGMPWEHEAERRGDKVEKLDILAVFSTPATARSRVYENRNR